eukprot:6180614-Pleurochrysis_carterae.AAC.2
MMQMPNPFDAPLTAAERGMLDSLLSDEDSCEEFTPPAAALATSSSSQAASGPACKYKSHKGKYERKNGTGIRSGWEAAAKQPMKRRQ